MVWLSSFHIYVILFYKVIRNDCITLNLHSTSPRMDGRTNGRTNQRTDKAGSSCVACEKTKDFQKQVTLGHSIVADG